MRKLVPVFFTFLAILLSSCGKQELEEDVQSTGEKIDLVTEKLKSSTQDAADRTRDALEKAGDETGEALEKVKEKAGDSVEVARKKSAETVKSIKNATKNAQEKAEDTFNRD